MHAQLAFLFPANATFEQVSAAVALHFGGEAVDLSTGELTPLRDASAIFTGTSQMTVSTGADINTTEPGAELDINGLPWDDRIHSSSKNKNADGSWRGRKGVAPPIIAKVKAELLSKRPAAASAPTGSQQSLQNGDEAARVARLAYAEEQAFIQAGQAPCAPDVLDKLKKGQLVTVAPYVEAWFLAWQGAFNNAYKEYADATLATTAASQGVQMGMQAINPNAASNQPVTLTPGVEHAKDAAAVFAAAPAAGPDVNTFAGFAVKHAALAASPVLAEVLGTLGIAGGFAALPANEVMLPAVNALLAAKGIV